MNLLLFLTCFDYIFCYHVAHIRKVFVWYPLIHLWSIYLIIKWLIGHILMYMFVFTFTSGLELSWVFRPLISCLEVPHIALFLRWVFVLEKHIVWTWIWTFMSGLRPTEDVGAQVDVGFLVYFLGPTKAFYILLMSSLWT